VGQSVSIDAEAYQVVGVLPRGTTWLGLDAYEPLVLSPERSRSDHRWQVVARLRKELGVRIALGASGGEVVALVMRQGMVPAVLGIGAGLVATMGVSRASGSLLYGVSATDPLTYLGVGLLLAAAATTACWIPARATLKMEASSVLREE
jgi:hypothetical protein